VRWMITSWDRRPPAASVRRWLVNHNPYLTALSLAQAVLAIVMVGLSIGVLLSKSAIPSSNWLNPIAWGVLSLGVLFLAGSLIALIRSRNQLS
jgi:hypothetical protein